jgi:pyruvate dehydrogenase E2 component (dihydrolipoamide acetyltransferase)
MLKDVTVPEVAENVEEGKVIGLLVSPGDRVEQDQSLIELETDQAVVAIPSPVAGVLKEFTVGEGDSLAVGAVFARVDTDGAGGAEAVGREEEAEAAPAQETGPEPAPEPEPARKPETRRQAEAEQQPEATRKPEDRREPEPERKPETERKPEPARQTTPARAAIPTPADDVGAPASPAVRRLARELGVDIGDVTGTGPRGRITQDDVREHVRRLLHGEPAAAPAARSGVTPATREASAGAPAAARPAADAGAAKAPDGDSPADDALPDFTRWGPVTVEELPTVRRLTGEVMTRAWTTIPMVTQRDRADVTELERFRKQWNGRRGENDAKLTMTAILLKICAAALREFPRFNSSVDWPRRELVVKDYVNIGVAVDTDRGLLVPVVREPDRKGVAELAAELADLAARTRSKKVSPDELDGGNFTISNLGGIGGTSFDPIVYPPQVAILGVDAAAQEAVWRDGAFAPRLRVPLSLTYDHRVIDGAEGARFLRWICEALEQPLLLSMGGGA